MPPPALLPDLTPNRRNQLLRAEMQKEARRSALGLAPALPPHFLPTLPELPPPSPGPESPVEFESALPLSFFQPEPSYVPAPWGLATSSPRLYNIFAPRAERLPTPRIKSYLLVLLSRVMRSGSASL